MPSTPALSPSIQNTLSITMHAGSRKRDTACSADIHITMKKPGKYEKLRTISAHRMINSNVQSRIFAVRGWRWDNNRNQTTFWDLYALDSLSKLCCITFFASCVPWFLHRHESRDCPTWVLCDFLSHRSACPICAVFWLTSSTGQLAVTSITEEVARAVSQSLTDQDPWV